VIDVLRAYLGQHFADRTTRHGVFMDILGLGVLLTGESGLGKSELGLELISRGTAWWPTMRWTCTASVQTALEGRCPDCCATCWKCAASACWTSRPSSARPRCAARCGCKLIVHLVRKETMERDFERLPYEPLYEDVLGMPVRKVVIAVDAGRNLAVLVEAAVRNTILQLRGIDTYQEFIERHQRAMEKAGRQDRLSPAARAVPGACFAGAGAGSRPWCSGVQRQRSAPAGRSRAARPPRAGASRSRRRRTPRRGRRSGTPGGRGAGPR
jgi:HPr kinase/phosphorylase